MNVNILANSCCIALLPVSFPDIDLQSSSSADLNYLFPLLGAIRDQTSALKKITAIPHIDIDVQLLRRDGAEYLQTCRTQRSILRLASPASEKEISEELNGSTRSPFTVRAA